MTAPLIELRHVSKRFGATLALDDVSFDVRPGEVHALAGENGAGKSTLIRVLSGAITDHEGELYVGGRRARLKGARDAARHGVATIHQELSLVGSMTVAENLALPVEGPMLGWARGADEVRAARRALDEVGLDLDPRALVESLPLAARQLLEIARALAQNARVLILDEPTSALSEPDADVLLGRVERLARAGCGVVYISHRMEEIDRVARRITVLCDGRVAACRDAKDLPRKELVALMMGGRRGAPPEPDGARERIPPKISDKKAAGDALLDVRDLRLDAPGTARLRGVSFSADAGEIVGLAGLRGSGAPEVLAALFGAHGRRARAQASLAGEPFDIESPRRSIERGVVLLAGDRRRAVLYDLSVAENITLSSLDRLAPRGVLGLAQEARVAADMTARLRVAAPSLDAEARALSGGNQQKVALLRCLATGPRVLLCDEPARGVDVGAKEDIHRALRALADEGKAVVVVAQELKDLISLCDRVVVMHRGRAALSLERDELTPERLRMALDEPAGAAAQS